MDHVEMDHVEMDSFYDPLNLNNINGFTVDSIPVIQKRKKYPPILIYCGYFLLINGIYSIPFILGYQYYNISNTCLNLINKLPNY